MASSTAVQTVAESGEVRRREFDHVGSGVVKYGATISHTLKTWIRVSSTLSSGNSRVRQHRNRQIHTSSRPKSETNSNRCSFGCSNEVGITGGGGGIDGGGACFGGTFRLGSDATVGLAGRTGVPSLGCPFVAMLRDVLLARGHAVDFG